MKYRYIRAFIVLLAGLITLIMNMKTGRNVTESLFIVLVVLLVFYVLATLVVEILERSMENSNQQEDVSEEDDEEVSESNDAEPLEEEESEMETSEIRFDDDDE